MDQVRHTDMDLHESHFMRHETTDMRWTSFIPFAWIRKYWSLLFNTHCIVLVGSFLDLRSLDALDEAKIELVVVMLGSTPSL